MTGADKMGHSGEVELREAERTREGHTLTVYKDHRFTLGREQGEAVLTADGRRYKLGCHPYEPCLYITDETGACTAVHNAFDPLYVLEAFYGGEKVTSVTGRTYTAREFCRMVSYAAGRGDINIDDAERAFGETPENRDAIKKRPEETATQGAGVNGRAPESALYCPEDPFYAVYESYPRSAAQICLIKNLRPYEGYSSHRRALAEAAALLFADEEGGFTWGYDTAAARGEKITAEALLSSVYGEEKMTFRRAFSDPPHGNRYTDGDFMKLVCALFPQGTQALEVYEWTTDWSEYFDDGHEWWGALCLTVYDKNLNRFAVITASATD